jgi:hypothetical protein
MTSSRPLTIAIAVIAVLLLVWTLWPTPEPGVPEPDPRRVAAKRAAVRPLRPLKPGPLQERRAAPEVSSETTEAGATGDTAAEARTPDRRTRRERALAKRGLARARATARAGQARNPQEPDGAVNEDPGDSAISGAPPQNDFQAPPDSPFEGMTQDELLEYIVALRRLRDSGALRRVQPEDYWRIMELEPESRGLQDADRIMQELFGMGIGEWLAKNRGPQSFSLQ